MTPDKNFRMSKMSKTMIALMPGNTDAHIRGHYKRMLVQCQLAEEAAKRSALKSKDRGSRESAPQPE
jgi:hypothetical protein